MQLVEVRQSGNTFFQSNAGNLSFSGSSGFVSTERITSNRNTSPDTYNDGTPHHAVATFPARSTSEGGIVHLYVDNIDYGIQGPIGLTGSGRADHRVNIGGRWSSPGIDRHYDGFVDEVTVYDYELAASQIAKHYNAGAFGTFT